MYIQYLDKNFFLQIQRRFFNLHGFTMRLFDITHGIKNDSVTLGKLRHRKRYR